MNSSVRGWDSHYGGTCIAYRGHHKADVGQDFGALVRVSICHEDDVVIAHLQPRGQEITAWVTEVDLENDWNERPAEPHHVGTEQLRDVARLLPVKEHCARIGLQVTQAAGFRHGFGEIKPPSVERDFVLCNARGVAACGPKGNEFLLFLIDIESGRRAKYRCYFPRS